MKTKPNRYNVLLDKCIEGMTADRIARLKAKLNRLRKEK